MTMSSHQVGTLTHEGLLYRGRADLLAGTVPFVEAGLAGGEPILVAMPGPHLDLLRVALRHTGDAVDFVDLAEAGRNPGRIIPYVFQAFVDRHPGRRVRIVSEAIWPGRAAPEYPACAQHEALVNSALRHRPAHILCPYDRVGLDAPALVDARAAHPVLVGPAGRRPSAHYDPDGVVARHNRPLPEPTTPVTALRYDLATLSGVRRLVTRHAAAVGLDEERQADLQIAVTELAANSVAHAGGSGDLRIWRTGEHLVCELADDGHLVDPLAGRLTPAADDVGGRGLVIVHALCDLVLLHTTDAGTTVRLHMRLTGPPLPVR
ncbi:sensor histidine kinase [Micromonospora sp. WMMD882]|uniref:sensor histidine kinase n=1 Tax=Micromonospora sp. WMMD882 TaxID=3015151 RepID=UPI00248B00D1|nr:sensor histidine kinase [Micromonospora sp. WMMD882]WBB80765.1 sensor histidine kinase [Micromonospora sp. WMMD882]